MTDPTQHIDPPQAPGHAYLSVDVETMARMVNLDKRRVQQLAKEGKFFKNDVGEYDLIRNMQAYIQILQQPKRTRASGLTKKQEESLEIRNARDRVEVLRTWDEMVLRASVVRELASIVVALKSRMQELQSTMANPVVLFAREHAVPIVDKQVQDYELMAKAQKMLAGPIRDGLDTFIRDVQAWAEDRPKPEPKKAPEEEAAQ